MITIDKAKLQAVIAAYKKEFPTHIGDEIYKWKALKKFQDVWDIDAPDFGAMFREATSLHENLLLSANHYPKGMVEEMCAKEPEEVREMFRDLFNEDLPLEDRIVRFIASSEKIKSKYWPDKNHYQDINSISTYLWFRYPEKYYIYKYSEVRVTTRTVGSSYVVKKGANAAAYKLAIEFFDIIRDAIQKDPEVRPMLNAVLTSDCYKDESLNCMVVDFDYFVGKYYKPESPAPAPKTSHKVWMYAPGNGASEWEDCLMQGIMMIGWDDLGDLSQYESRDAMWSEMRGIYNKDNPRNDSLTTWNFFDGMEIGDIVYVRRGRSTILGRGVVESDYYFDESREYFNNCRKVRWTEQGEWQLEQMTDIKTITEITQYDDYLKRLDLLVTTGKAPEEDCQYFWLVASPAIWSMTEWPVGEEQEYSLYNANNNKRHIFRNFTDAKAGDKVICYEAHPTKEIVALAIITRGSDGKSIAFEKTETLTSPIPLSTLKDAQELKDMEFFANHNGSLFKLTKDEYTFIMDLVRESNDNSDTKKELIPYTDKEFLEDVFMSESDLQNLKTLLESKKNVILQGAPGVGKTFAAKRLAYTMMKEKDDSRIGFVQFHQNYSYEDFVLGYKPSEETFKLQRGIFYKFCIVAANNPDKDYFFIIDEINRGNLSKIFGELLMLIEKDYRGTQISLAYSEEKFFVPANIYIIGMMNTADRSLAMIDYALRRRFSFYEMKPGFKSDGFKKYQNSLANVHLDRLIAKVQELNDKIREDGSLGPGFEIGHSYFCGQNKVSDAWLHQVIDYDIIPMLKEYWFDNRDEVKKWEAELSKVFDD